TPRDRLAEERRAVLGALSVEAPRLVQVECDLRPVLLRDADDLRRHALHWELAVELAGVEPVEVAELVGRPGKEGDGLDVRPREGEHAPASRLPGRDVVRCAPAARLVA